MRISMTAVIFLVYVVLVSVFVANVADLISIDERNFGDKGKHGGGGEKPKKFQIGDGAEELMWFLQISDIHISIFKEPDRITQFKEFCDLTVSAFKPPVVIASGDLTDAKARDAMGSGQHLDEWKHYKRVLDESRVLEKTTWLDVRGNHDNFNILNIDAPDNYFLNYSAQGKHHSRSYLHQITVNSRKYSFIAVDACLQPGPKRPFNFVGFLDAKEMETIEKLAEESKRLGSESIIWFGHYPTSSILYGGDESLRDVMAKNKDGLAYLCGHYHTLAGIAPEMYTLQRGGYLELELADWKDNRMYRLGVIDHGQFSFIDNHHADWPVALITNPKHALFSMPHRENLESIIDSTHIRILAFSTAPIKSVSARINNEKWIQCQHIEGPLFVARWNSSKYLHGIHQIKTRVIDELNREKEITQPFSLDGSRLAFKILARFILMFDATKIFAIAFGIIVIITVIPLCVLRFCHKLVITKKMLRPKIQMKCLQVIVRKFWILSTIDYFFWPLILYPLYLVFGPWSAGEIIENSFGVIFVWGMFIDGQYLPGSFTYAYGFYQLFLTHLPLIVILAFAVDRRFEQLEKPYKKRANTFVRLARHLPFVLLLSFQISMAYFFWLAYGNLATILCPFRSWCILGSIALWYLANSLPAHRLRGVVSVWSSTKRLSTND